FTEPHSSIGLTITFDEPANEYATDFDVVAYDASNNVIKDIKVRGNTNARCVVEDGMADYERIVITLLKWCKPHRRAKITEVSFGVVRVYDDQLFRVNLLEEIDPVSAQVPSNELKFVVDNSSREFNILNPTGSYKFLQERQALVVELGVETSPNFFEYVNMG